MFTELSEMQRTNLAHVVLQLKALGIDDILHFDFISSPPSENMIRALEVNVSNTHLIFQILYSLGVLDDHCKLTNPVGNIISEFPGTSLGNLIILIVDPYLAKMLISSGLQYNCSEEVMTIAALLSGNLCSKV